jgi:hypothetical protein
VASGRICSWVRWVAVDTGSKYRARVELWPGEVLWRWESKLRANDDDQIAVSGSVVGGVVGAEGIESEIYTRFLETQLDWV